MTEIRFYHLTKSSLEKALPELLEKSLQRNWRVVVQVENDDIAEKLNKDLWTIKTESFIPHGSKKDGNASKQPIWITSKEENPNNANILFLIDGAVCKEIEKFDLVCEVFNGNYKDQTDKARDRWKLYKEKSHSLTYWKQTENGWEKKE